MILALLPEVSLGQTPALTITSPQTAPPTTCGDPYWCCTEYTITVPAGASYTLQFSIYGTINPSPTTCFAWSCLQIDGTGTTITNTTGTNDVVIKLPYSSSAATYHFWICGDPTCMGDYGLMNAMWEISSGTPPNDAGFTTLNTCGDPWDGCLPCDQVQFDVIADGSYQVEICVERGSINYCLADEVEVCFNPPLPYIAPPPPPGCVFGLVKPGSYDATHWTHNYVLNGAGDSIDCIEFFLKPGLTDGYGGLGPCESFCFRLATPECGKDSLWTECLTALTYVPPTVPPCTDPPNYSCPCFNSRDFKQSGGQRLGSDQTLGTDQNYPNPLEAATGFKTTIPFTTSDKGVASIRIMDVTGKEILNDAEEATYAGTHFFYFTGDKLPAGTYYYTIEFPKGVVIASKTMLVVK